MEYWNCGKLGHIKKNWRKLKKDGNKNNTANVVNEEVQDALLLFVDSFGFWVLDSRVSFHTTIHHKITDNC